MGVGISSLEDPIRTKGVVSTIGLQQSIDLLPAERRWRVPYLQHNKDDAMCLICLLVGLDGSGIELPAEDIWYYPYEIDQYQENWVKYLELNEMDKMPVLITCPTVKQKSQSADKSSLQIFAPVKMKLFKPQTEDVQQKLDAYNKLKE